MTDEEYRAALLEVGIPVVFDADKDFDEVLDALCGATHNKALRRALSHGRFWHEDQYVMVLPDVKTGRTLSRELRAMATDDEDESVAAEVLADEIDEALATHEETTSRLVMPEEQEVSEDNVTRIYVTHDLFKQIQRAGGWPNPKAPEKRGVFRHEGALYVPGLSLEHEASAARVVPRRSWSGRVHEGPGSWRRGGLVAVGGKEYVIETIVDFVREGSPLDDRRAMAAANPRENPDDQRRDMERQFRSAGTTETKCAAIVARLRSATINMSCVAAAAALGDKAARRVLAVPDEERLYLYTVQVDGQKAAEDSRVLQILTQWSVECVQDAVRLYYTTSGAHSRDGAWVTELVSRYDLAVDALSEHQASSDMRALILQDFHRAAEQSTHPVHMRLFSMLWHGTSDIIFGGGPPHSVLLTGSASAEFVQALRRTDAMESQRQKAIQINRLVGMLLGDEPTRENPPRGDELLRDIERQARASMSTEDLAAWLSALERSGKTPEDLDLWLTARYMVGQATGDRTWVNRIDIAAALGFAPARQAMGAAGSKFKPFGASDYSVLVDYLPLIGREAAIQWGCDVLDHGVAAYGNDMSLQFIPNVVSMIRDVGRWSSEEMVTTAMATPYTQHVMDAHWALRMASIHLAGATDNIAPDATNLRDVRAAIEEVSRAAWRNGSFDRIEEEARWIFNRLAQYILGLVEVQ